MEHPMRFRFLAGVLAAGGIFWGLLASGVILHFHTTASLVFIPSYIITAGYIIRCIYTPQLLWRRVIWGASAIVQGLWLVSIVGICIWFYFEEGGSLEDYILHPIIAWVWWTFALGVSIYGFRFDKRLTA
jgi:hypothetical protein